MDIATMLHNGSLASAKSMLCTPDMLAIGAAAHQASNGTPEDKLAAAVTAMIEANKRPVEPLDIDEDLEALTRPQLYRMANHHRVHVLSSYRKDELIRALRREQHRRLEFS